MCVSSLKKPKFEISKTWIAKFCETHHIIKLALFGSVLSDHFSASSDIDILVEFDPHHIPGLFGMSEMQQELSKTFGREVDLRTPEDISKLFRKDVIEQSYLMYGQERFKSA